MTLATSENGLSGAGSLALQCLAHLEQEEAMLGATLDSLRRVRAALVRGDLAALGASLEHQQHTARAAAELRVGRARLRDELARALRVPARSVSVQMLASRLSGTAAERLARCRERLKGMAIEVDELNRGNAALVRHSLDFLHHLLAELTGTAPAGDRYGPEGKRQQAACGSLIQARG